MPAIETLLVDLTVVVCLLVVGFAWLTLSHLALRDQVVEDKKLAAEMFRLQQNILESLDKELTGKP